MALIVSRHQATIEWLRGHPRFRDAEVCTGNATPDLVRGRIVAGNLPLHLACLCQEYWAVEFAGPPPRGQDLDAAAFLAARPVLVRYRVERVDDLRPARDEA